MKDAKMNHKSPYQNRFCKVCETPLIYVDHYEYDGVTDHGSHEPYWECPQDCAYPDCADSELTAEELAERGRVDTCTEFGIISINDWSRGAVML